MRQHRLDFVRRKPLEQRVEEDDAPRAPEAREERVAVAGAPRAVHHEEAAVLEADTVEQRLDRGARRTFGQRRELVEQRSDHGGVEREEQELEPDPERPGPDPPQRSRGLHQPQHERRERQPQCRADQNSLREVGDPERARRPVEAELRFDAECLPVREGQSDDTGEHRDRDDQRQIAAERAERKRARPADQRREAAAQRQRQQQRGLDQDSRRCAGACARPCSRRPSDARTGRCGRRTRAARGRDAAPRASCAAGRATAAAPARARARRRMRQ